MPHNKMIKENSGMNGIPWDENLSWDANMHKSYSFTAYTEWLLKNDCAPVSNPQDDTNDMILECLLNKYSNNEEAKRFILNLSPESRFDLMILESQMKMEAYGQNS